jgi:hypothetical protein
MCGRRGTAPSSQNTHDEANNAKSQCPTQARTHSMNHTLSKERSPGDRGYLYGQRSSASKLRQSDQPLRQLMRDLEADVVIIPRSQWYRPTALPLTLIVLTSSGELAVSHKSGSLQGRLDCSLRCGDGRITVCQKLIEGNFDRILHPILDACGRIVRRCWKGLDTLVRNELVDHLLFPADVSPLQVDLGGHAPGVIFWPPQIR